MTSDAALIDAIDRHFRKEGAPDRLGVAVSGGSDSLALLHLLHAWGRANLAAATVDHGLRADSADEAELVSGVCEGLGISHTVLEWRRWDGRGNLQDQARQNRYALLAGWAKERSVGSVCLGHTQDDQAETFLMRLARESGIDGLTSMSAVMHRGGLRFDRPILTLGRDELQDYLDQRGIAWISDPSNDDDKFDRIKAREALATLEPLGISVRSIARTVANLSLERFVITEKIREVAIGLVEVSDGDLLFDRTAFRQQNREVQRRLLSAALQWIASETYPPRREALANALSAISDVSNTTLHGCLILVSNLTVRITREFNAVRSLTSPTNKTWDGRWTLDGPHDDGLAVRALGESLASCPDWQETGVPRQSLMSSPAVWRGDELVAAPLAGLSKGWTAKTPDRDHFAASLISR